MFTKKIFAKHDGDFLYSFLFPYSFKLTLKKVVKEHVYSDGKAI